ncbi:MAG: hypothetical protein HFI41_03425 [Lachnospiraceae bacterium]|nr:hypothetical protein [Lachnospiraceae bacterium]
MGKNARLANIYIKIHNKYALTLEDLKYLSKYDPECFEKACKNIVYKVPETKRIMQPGPELTEHSKDSPPREGQAPKEEQKEQELQGTRARDAGKTSVFDEPPVDKQWIESVLSNLKQMEQKDLPVEEVPVEQVKELLGNLYMEMLFPHNDRMKYFNMEDHKEVSVFNKKA